MATKKKNLLNLTIAPLTLSSPSAPPSTTSTASNPSTARSAQATPRVSEEVSSASELAKELDGYKMKPKPSPQISNPLTTRELTGADFDSEEPLGSGNGGVVLKVREKASGAVLARKVIHLEIKPSVKAQIVRELKVLHECNSNEIVGFYGSYISDMEINILMEYMDVGSLDKVLKRVGRIEENVVRHICHSVLTGLVYLRDHFNVMHRDVKPSNILLNTQGQVKLCDFGVSGELTNSLAATFVGTRSYMAPERFLGDKYALESDIWSLGLSLIELATGRFPIPPNDSQPPLVAMRRPTDPTPVQPQPDVQLAIFELLAHIVEGPSPSLPQGQGFSPHFVDFISKCCAKKPADRAGLNALLAHPWMQGVSEHAVDMAAWAQSTLPPGGAKPDRATSLHA